MTSLPSDIPRAMPIYSWALQAAGVEPLHSLGLTGLGVRIGHLDSGISATDKNLIRNIQQYCYIDDEGTVHSSAIANDCSGHGTSTASLLVGGSRERMFIGVAPKAKLLTGQVLEGGASVVRILSGLNWLAEQQVPIILFCGGFPTSNPVLGPMLSNLRRSGTLVICPIGNSGSRKFRQPGDDVNVLSIGAVDIKGRVAKFSGSRMGRFAKDVLAPDILGPGVAVPCGTSSAGFRPLSGTSMAAAITAGVAALLLESEPDATVNAICNALSYGSRKLEEHQSKHARCGLLDGSAALAYLQKNKNNTTSWQPERTSIIARGWKDVRLLYQLKNTQEEGEVTAVYILFDSVEISLWETQVQKVLKPIFLKDIPKRVKYLPRGRAVIVAGTPRLHQIILTEVEMIYASAADAGKLLITNQL